MRSLFGALFVAAAAPAFFAAAASAELLMSEDFNYANGALAGNSGGTGWGWEWENTSANDVDVFNGAATFTYFNNGGYTGSGATRWLGTWYGDDESDLWLRATVHKTQDNGSYDSFGGIGFYADGNEVGLLGNFWPGSGPNAWGAGFGGGVAESASAFVTDLSDVVAHINFSTGAIEVWINADMMNMGDADFVGYGITAFNSLRLRGGSDAGGTESWMFDNLLLGTEGIDVGVGIPAPGALALLGMAGLFGSRRRQG
jgi:MYXO-CTERM domain-containing protein